MIATYAEVRVALLKAAAKIGHPTKGNYIKKGVDTGIPHNFGAREGTVVYREGGEVGLAILEKKQLHYFVARGDSHEASCYALANHLGLTAVRRKEDHAVLVPEVGIQVDEVDAGHFWLWCLPKGFKLTEG